ncbi:MAG TPA: tetratricopeptide repeat-containing glycosyltransferase family protein [Patescibacteria group bacterium]|nr:tetratricopeptide repeat-containing glycosyltransferase family protein [Patescibacteria group bacterium]
MDNMIRQNDAIHLLNTGQPAAALAVLQQALVQQPDSAELHYKLGVLHRSQKQNSLARVHYQQAVILDPGFWAAHFNLAILCQEEGQMPDAERHYRQALLNSSDPGPILCNLASLLQSSHRQEEALSCLRQAVTLRPDLPEIQNNLGNCLQTIPQLAEAESCYRKAIQLAPEQPISWYNLAVTLHLQGRLEESLAAYDQVLALAPDWLEARSNRSHTLLLKGDLEAGFTAYEERIRKSEHLRYHRWAAPLPRWQGEHYTGRRLLIYFEQGLGDCIQFIRYLPLVKARGGTLLFSVPTALQRLFQNFPGVDELLLHGVEPLAKHRADLALPLMSLPRLFGSTLNTIPLRKAYLQPAPQLVSLWRQRLTSPYKKIGLVWAGNPAYDHEPSRRRTCPLTALAPLFTLPNREFYSLQKGAAAAEIAQIPPGTLHDLSAELHDFIDTAAIIASLDIVVSVDTSVAHLAAALGKPVYVLLPYAPEWRWLLRRSDSPWYPSMRLFRQTVPGDWSGPVAALLNTFTSRDGAP